MVWVHSGSHAQQGKEPGIGTGPGPPAGVTKMAFAENIGEAACSWNQRTVIAGFLPRGGGWGALRAPII